MGLHGLFLRVPLSLRSWCAPHEQGSVDLPLPGQAEPFSVKPEVFLLLAQRTVVSLSLVQPIRTCSGHKPGDVILTKRGV